MKRFRWIFPSTVQILSNKTTAIVAIDHTVWVEHRNYFKHKIFSEHPRLRGRARQVVDYPLHAPGAIALAWMDTRWYEHTLLAKRSFWLGILVLGCNRYEVTTVSSQSPCQCRPMVIIAWVRLVLNLLKILAQIRVRVWEAMSEVNLIVIGLERVGEC